MCTNSTRLPLPHTRTCLLLLCLNTADSHPCNCSTVNAAPTPTRFHAPRPQISRIRNPRTPTKALDCNPKAARKDRRSLSRRSHENMRRFLNDVGPWIQESFAAGWPLRAPCLSSFRLRFAVLPRVMVLVFVILSDVFQSAHSLVSCVLIFLLYGFHKWECFIAHPSVHLVIRIICAFAREAMQPRDRGGGVVACGSQRCGEPRDRYLPLLILSACDIFGNVEM